MADNINIFDQKVRLGPIKETPLRQKMFILSALILPLCQIGVFDAP
jgi:hypothetical protein